MANKGDIVDEMVEDLSGSVSIFGLFLVIFAPLVLLVKAFKVTVRWGEDLAYSPRARTLPSEVEVPSNRDDMSVKEWIQNFYRAQVLRWEESTIKDVAEVETEGRWTYAKAEQAIECMTTVWDVPEDSNAIRILKETLERLHHEQMQMIAVWDYYDNEYGPHFDNDLGKFLDLWLATNGSLDEADRQVIRKVWKHGDVTDEEDWVVRWYNEEEGYGDSMEYDTLEKGIEAFKNGVEEYPSWQWTLTHYSNYIWDVAQSDTHEHGWFCEPDEDTLLYWEGEDDPLNPLAEQIENNFPWEFAWADDVTERGEEE